MKTTVWMFVSMPFWLAGIALIMLAFGGISAAFQKEKSDVERFKFLCFSIAAFFLCGTAWSIAAKLVGA